MRFETDVLTRERNSGLFVEGDDRVIREDDGVGFNATCAYEIEKRGWRLPKRTGSQIVLVFSTTRVVGASTCKLKDLYYAGRFALEKVARQKVARPPPIRFRKWRWTFDDGTKVSWNDRLWWWPEIVS